MKTVIAFGAFDLVHEGHKYFLNEARKYGNKLIVIVARNKTIEKIKGQKPLYNEKKRMNDIKSLGIANIVELGDKKDKMSAIKKYKPEVIAIGHDQNSFIYELSEYLKINQLKTSVVTIDGYKIEKYKSSKIKNL